ncbi:MAG: hypothetical protein HQ579_06600 [Candidatus Omnitrophica bacterium]|nr:hypothetical protein [Candidatus Omnitrophota bacterium]
MEIELNNLIEKIKKEGVDKAEKDANSIINQAKEKANGIIRDAEEKKAEIIKEAELCVSQLKKTQEKALKQAARDILLTLRGRVIEFFQRVVKEKVADQLKSDVLKEIIVKTLSNFRKDQELDVDILLSKEDKEKLKKYLFDALSQEAKKHITLTPVKGIEKGFRIGEKGKDSYFDFSDEAIAEAFARYLNPQLVEILDIDLGLGGGKT